MGPSSNSLVSPNRRRAFFLLAGVGGAWLAVLVLCLFQYTRVRELRDDVEAHVRWLIRADQVRLDVGSATKSALQSGPETVTVQAAQQWLTDCRLADQMPFQATESETRDEACEALTTWLQQLSLSRTHPEAMDSAALSLAQIRVAETLGELIIQVRRETGDISTRLGGLWMVLSVLGVFLVGLSGTLAVSLLASRRRAALLRQAKEMVEESELRLERRVQQRTAELEASNRKLAQEVVERKQLELEVLEIDRCERERIGADLHDGLAQHLVGASLLQKSLANKLVSKGIPEAEAAAKISRLISEAVQQSRALARGLAAVESTSKGLRPALESLAADANVLFGVPCQVRTNGSDSAMDIETRNHLFRIAQEAVHNAAKHSDAKQIVIELTATDSELALRVTDDGVGIPEAAVESEGLGLRLMKHRASLIDGTLSVERMPQGGTTVACSFSL